MKNIHIPTIEELLRPEPEFSIERAENASYRIAGIQHRGQNLAYFLGRRLLISESQDECAKDASIARPSQYRSTSAPLIYAICKTLYQNRDGKQEKIVEEARAFLNSAFEHNLLLTLSRAIYNNLRFDEIIHDYKQNTKDRMKAKLTGPQGYITKPGTEARLYLQAVLDTTDNPPAVNYVFKWITGKDSYIWRLGEDSGINTCTRAVLLGVSNNDAFIISTIGIIKNRRPTLAIRPAKTKK